MMGTIKLKVVTSQNSAVVRIGLPKDIYNQIAWIITKSDAELEEKMER